MVQGTDYCVLEQGQLAVSEGACLGVPGVMGELAGRGCGVLQLGRGSSWGAWGLHAAGLARGVLRRHPWLELATGVDRKSTRLNSSHRP